MYMGIENLPSKPSKPSTKNPAETEFIPNTGDPEIDNLGNPPIRFIGHHGFDPRSARSYPDTPEEKVDLLNRMHENELNGSSPP
jgi:hypothetical protein